MSLPFTRSKETLAISLLVCACCFGAAPANRGFWSDHARPLPILTNETITALARVENTLYIAAGEKLFITKLGGTGLTDVTAKLLKQPADQVTRILVDEARQNTWIVTNDNLRLAECYSFSLQAKHCESTFIENELTMYERLSSNAPAPSIAAMAYDDRGAIVGFFKDGVYLYSMSDGKYRLVFKPQSAYKWATGALLTPAFGFVATRGDGLLVIDRATGSVSRFLDKHGQYIRTLAVDDGGNLYIGAFGLYKASLKDFMPAGTVQNGKVGG